MFKKLVPFIKSSTALVILIGILNAPCMVKAQINSPTSQKSTLSTQENSKTVSEPVVKESWEQKFIKSNIYISNFFDRVAERIDIFLARGRKTNKRNQTSIRVENITTSTEGVPVTNNVHLNVNLQLPNVEKYWQLKFTTYDETEERRSVRRGFVQSGQRQTNYGAQVGLFKKLGDIKVSFEPRVELQDPLKVSHYIRFKSDAELETYQVFPTLEFFAHPDKGTGIYTSVVVNFPIESAFNLSVINDGEYQEALNMFTSNSGLSLNQTITDLKSMTYATYANLNNRPNYHLESFSLSVTWSEILYKKVMDYQITPHLVFAEDLRFKGTAGLTLNLNFNF